MSVIPFLLDALAIPNTHEEILFPLHCRYYKGLC